VDLTVEVRRGAGVLAHVVELPGCFASGATLPELREALAEAIGLYLWDRPASLGGSALRVGEVEIAVTGPEEG